MRVLLTAAGCPALRIEGLDVALGGAPALRRVHLSIAEGERVALIGESGSGKSTLASALTGILASHAQVRGQIHVGARRVDPFVPAPVDHPHRVGLIAQDSLTALNPLVRIGPQVAEPLRARGLGRAAADAQAIALLAAMELPDPDAAARSHPGQLSGGQRQRVGIAVALASRPFVLVADEPTPALDTTVQRGVLEMVRTAAASGRPHAAAALILITHDLAAAAMVCERVVVLRRGVVVADGPIAQVLGDPQHPHVAELVEATATTSLRLPLPVPR